MKPGELVDTSFHQQIQVFLLRKKKNLTKRINQNIQQIKS
jgi:hypothetical protein